MYTGPLEKINDYKWLIPKKYFAQMRVDGIIYASEELLKDIKTDNAPQQVANVAELPGIVKYSLAMPDIHWGYGFCIGGVAATDVDKGGVISPGGVGFDINCGVRLIKTNFLKHEIAAKQKDILYGIFNNVPAGVGSEGSINVSEKEEQKILAKGAGWALEKGFAVSQDIENTEENGCMQGANPEVISKRAYERGKKQAGTLGSGNHFIEIQYVSDIYDEKAANVFGLTKNSVTIMIHTGSRGLGYQVCDDFSRNMQKTLLKYNIYVKDRQLACAPVQSPEGEEYIQAMKCAANYAWNNRQCITHIIRGTFEKIFSKSWYNMDMKLIYDVAHNIAKIEKHMVDGKEKTLCVHRKGATRAFPPKSKDIPDIYKQIGQPIIIPGDMGTASYLLTGTQTAMDETFGSTCHGAGRRLSRTQAKRSCKAENIKKELQRKGIYIMASGKSTITEEAPLAYKNIDSVVNVVEKTGISNKICRMRPILVIKG